MPPSPQPRAVVPRPRSPQRRRARPRRRSRRSRRNRRRPPPAARPRRAWRQIRRREFRTASAHHATRSATASKEGRSPLVSGLAEHDVVGAGFGGDHGVVPGRKPAAAGDARRLERRQRGFERIDPAQMGAVGAGACHEIGMPVEEQRCALVLHRRRKRLDVIDLPAFVGIRQAQQDGGDVGGAERVRHADARAPSDRAGSQDKGAGQGAAVRPVSLGTPWKSIASAIGRIGGVCRPSTLRDGKCY